MHQIAFGSADHHIHYFDLRNTSSPISVVRGHRKAVSYVRFLTASRMVSASTDCSLRLWDINTHIASSLSTSVLQEPLKRTFSGHLNEKNFVGLSVNSTGEYLACGSETNQVYVYFTHLPKPVAVYPFGNPIDAVTGLALADEDPTQFVSSVCWKRGLTMSWLLQIVREG